MWENTVGITDLEHSNALSVAEEVTINYRSNPEKVTNIIMP